MKHQWLRVSKQNPCGKCGKKDWCSFCPDLKLINCMRVASEKPCHSSLGGWLHPMEGTTVEVFREYKPEPVTEIDADFIWRNMRTDTEPKKIKAHAEQLGVEPYALDCLGAAWAQISQAWAFPMRDGSGKTIGIRLRNERGEKWAVKGSKQGLFIPFGCKTWLSPLYVCEGITDTAAAVTLGMFAIGRPSCMGCESFVNEVVSLKKIRNVVVISDNDDVGLKGAQLLQGKLRVPSVIFTPPTKDIREFTRLDGDKASVEAACKDLVWSQPQQTVTR